MTLFGHRHPLSNIYNMVQVEKYHQSQVYLLTNCNKYNFTEQNSCLAAKHICQKSEVRSLFILTFYNIINSQLHLIIFIYPVWVRETPIKTICCRWHGSHPSSYPLRYMYMYHFDVLIYSVLSTINKCFFFKQKKEKLDK